MEYNASTHYFTNVQLLQSTLLPYFCEEEPLNLINKQFNKLNYEKYNTRLQPHGIVKTYHDYTKALFENITYKNGKKNGLYQMFYTNGSLVVNGYYKDDEFDGLWEEWYIDSIYRSKIYYKNGNRSVLFGFS